MRTYILVHTWDYADDGFTIIAAFSTIEKLREYVRLKYPSYKIDYEGNYTHKIESKYTEHEYLTIYEEEIK